MQLDLIPNRLRTSWTALAVLLAVLAPSRAARADFTYTDGSFGVSIRLPDNTSVSRIKNPAGETGTEIAQFTLPEGNVIGRLVVSDLPADWTFEKATATVLDQLARDGNVEPDKIVADKPKVQGNSKAATLLQAWDAEHKMLNGVLLVQGPSDQILIVYVATHDIPRDKAATLLKQLTSGFTVLLQAKDEQRLATAMARGPEILMNLVSPIPKPDDLWDKQYLLMSTGKAEPFGYIVISESLEDRNKKPGLAVTTERWVFQAGSAEYELQKAFTSWDLHDDEWSSRIDTILEIQGKPPQLITSSHKILRLGQQLMVETIDPQSKGKPANRVLPCPRIIVPQAWRWLLPRLLARADGNAKLSGAGEWIALITYTPVRRGMETQMFSRASHAGLLEVLQREGLYGMVENWQFTPGGELKRISSSDLTLTPGSEADVKSLFAGRVAQWKDKVAPKKK